MSQKGQQSEYRQTIANCRIMEIERLMLVLITLSFEENIQNIIQNSLIYYNSCLQRITIMSTTKNAPFYQKHGHSQWS